MVMQGLCYLAPATHITLARTQHSAASFFLYDHFSFPLFCGTIYKYIS